jgi:hypothetical protein|tara:strand:+ start:342 stop:578 length:237 start_codon:yes stop_codon:yes gene_type:complete
MFTVEFDNDCTEIVVMDDTAEFEDVLISLFNDYCYIEQHCNETNSYQRIMLTAEMYYKIMMAWKSTSGAYLIERENST